MLFLFKLAYKHSKEAKLNTIIVLILEICSILLLFELNSVYGGLYQAIQDYKIPQIWHNIAKFSGLAGILVLINGYLGYFINKLSFNIRTGLTKATQFHLNSLDFSTYAQQIQEDYRKFGESGVEMSTALFRAGIKLPLFAGVIMSLTHWYIGLIVILVVVVGTVLTKIAGKPLVALQSEMETREALFRLNTESVSKFQSIETQFKIINHAMKRLSFTQSGIGQAFALLPFIILMPLYISHAVTLGAFMQSVRALSTIIDALSVIIDNRQLLVNIQTCLLRLQFVNRLTDKK